MVGSVDENWITLPQIARELGVGDSTARRWATAFTEFLTARGSGAARRFHTKARTILIRVQQLYERGYSTDQVRETLRREFSATVEAVAVPESPRPSPSDAALLALADGLQVALRDMEMRLTTQMTTAQSEVTRLKAEIEALHEQVAQQNDALNLASGGALSTQIWTAVSGAIETAFESANNRLPHRSWWPPWKR